MHGDFGVLGLVVFLGLHSTRIVSESGREKAIARIGEGPWKGGYSLISAIGFVLARLGFARERFQAPQLRTPPPGARHTTMLLMLAALILLASYLFKRSHITAAVHHPMLWSVLSWSLAHLIANGSAADLVLFGAFLVWSVADLASAYARDRRNGTPIAARCSRCQAGAPRHRPGRLWAASWRPAPVAVRRVAARDVRRPRVAAPPTRSRARAKLNIEFAPRPGSYWRRQNSAARNELERAPGR